MAFRVLFAGALLAGSVDAGTLLAQAGCADGTHITVFWSFTENPAEPTGHPEWVGYDVERRPLASCGAYERLNAAPFPRTPGVSENFQYMEIAPATAAMFEYRVVPVDALRQPVALGFDCDFCSYVAWASCPDLSAALTQGTIEDIGWAVLVHPCPDGCYRSFYVENPEADALRPYAGTATVVRLFGFPFCGTVEGCGMHVDHFDLAPCAPTPTLPSTWGRIKAGYR
jgi:hypothetical protein